MISEGLRDPEAGPALGMGRGGQTSVLPTQSECR